MNQYKRLGGDWTSYSLYRKYGLFEGCVVKTNVKYCWYLTGPPLGRILRSGTNQIDNHKLHRIKSTWVNTKRDCCIRLKELIINRLLLIQ